MPSEPIAPYQGDEPYIFVSYSHEDSSDVHAELVQLRENGFNVWYDEGLSPGFAWRDELAHAIDRSSLFLFLRDESLNQLRQLLEGVELCVEPQSAAARSAPRANRPSAGFDPQPE